MKPNSASHTFYLDPEYKNFIPGVTELKFSTLSETGHWGAIFQIGLALCLMLLAFVPLVIGIQRDNLYRAQGREMTVRVMGCQMVKSGKNNRRPEVSYTYQIDGSHYNGSQRLSGNCSFYPIESTLRAMYLVNSPASSSIVTPEDLALPFMQRFSGNLLLFAIWLPMCGFISYPVWLYFRARRQYPRLVANGRLLEGRLVDIRSRTTNKGRSHYIHVRYQVENPEGKLLTRKQRQRREDLRGKNLTLPGVPIKVLYADDAAMVML